jgi:hypothetical protein
LWSTAFSTTKQGEIKMSPAFPQFISFGEALTDMIRLDDARWVSIPGGAPWNVAQVMACFGVAISRDCFGALKTLQTMILLTSLLPAV